ncbi:2-succinyl-6-hydroxy-2,4-cyclohexadiene-1-carboxylate synthase [Bacillus mojavensis]|uniref:2-succinyl-6-hydroxy-2, 4-cyclohexadiene-1-carboxylate synthase n=1 Tax=Bacillus mojavensis TaxID=72360 RepID=UPI000288643D|nr:2-succinyl-6-hydroxy-2,4-cyclohexadiene-1-carboxylate synthase [Bacillus mojavensis]MDR4226871.1 2-succinyl-6-hydroxy-2,4-cyclohexadiene-1-carboxylate synthase [Bacillus mojavensis]MEC1671308.1 2-succinyl-6-hydroxy-2,4-cyclohexadiene-1-carboxylate synthase [Bacillus mojavensis]MEC3589553.1 2-succinyl-6-hydroxy-2,4-cyclohexadiene-1-carboxylate synthase [Bacillus mojavensis]MEC5243555.1 2-succinyl-6-hydroxy-2,4-cyclohexadiene-1-carboxylate synthase [Bacillus mojavensis]MED0747770.1 2-succinyl
MGTVNITVADGVRYAVTDDRPNASDAVVCLHGFTGSKESWAFLDQLLPNSRVIKIDCLGHGESDAPLNGKRYSTSRQVSDLAEIFDHLKLHKVKLIGYSMGGRLAYSFAMTYPKRISALVLESTTPGLKTLGERKERILRDRKLADFILRDGIKAFVDYWEGIPLFSTQQRLADEVRQRIRLGRLRNNNIGLANSLIGMGTGSQPSWWSRLKDVAAPVLLICGEWDKKFCAINQEVHKKLPSSRIEIVPEAGHTVHVEQPHFFGKIVSEFLTNV